jgi:hypothetical protein
MDGRPIKRIYGGNRLHSEATRSDPLTERTNGIGAGTVICLHAGNIIVGQPPSDAAEIALQQGSPHLMWRDDDLTRLFATGRGDDDPIADVDPDIAWSKVVDTARVAKPDADDAFSRRAVELPQDGIVLCASAFTDLFPSLEPTLEPLASASPRLVNCRWRSPGAIYARCDSNLGQANTSASRASFGRTFASRSARHCIEARMAPLNARGVSPVNDASLTPSPSDSSTS